MNFVEEAVIFPCAGERLPGIITWPRQLHAEREHAADDGNPAHAWPGAGVSLPDPAGVPECRSRCGVLVVVGGPQYRVGSHRQFLLLARRLAGEGYPVMRFDCRGMGDGGGPMQSFEEASPDIGAAIDAFRKECTSVQRIVLWGLCDAASAALLYLQATHDQRVAGLVLLNPWVRSDESLAQTHIKHYYGQRLLQREFWWKLLSGRMELLKSVRGLFQTALAARGAQTQPEGAATRSFQEGMADGWRQFSGKVLLILSGQDYTAKEFLEFSASHRGWAALVEDAKVRRIDIDAADHTFSSMALRLQVEDVTLAWLETLPPA